MVCWFSYIHIDKYNTIALWISITFPCSCLSEIEQMVSVERPVAQWTRPVIWSISKFPDLPFYCVDNLWVFCWFLYEISQFLEPWMTYKLTVETSSTGCQLPFLIKRIQQFFIPLNLFIDLEGLRLLDQPLVRCMRMF